MPRLKLDPSQPPTREAEYYAENQSEIDDTSPKPTVMVRG